MSDVVGESGRWRESAGWEVRCWGWRMEGGA